MDECIIETLAYFDIFDYPLTLQEIKKFSGCKIEFSDEELLDAIDLIPVIQELYGYYYFLGREKIVSKRVERQEISIYKLAKAKIVAKILSFIPTIELIGISGSLSMNNASYLDDIDFFFIAKKGTLWITRMMVVLLLVILKQKRSKSGLIIKDKICPNMFLDKNDLSFTKVNKSLYTAHEIIQLKILVDRNDTYAKLISSNRWVKEYFPNVLYPTVRKRKSRERFSFEKLILPIEKFFYMIQKQYMSKDITHEVISKTSAQFHPIERQKIIMQSHKMRVDRYWELYESNLWVDKDDARFYIDQKKIRILN